MLARPAMRDLPHLVAAIFGTAHAIRADKLDIIVNAVAARIYEGQGMPATVVAPLRESIKFGTKAFARGGYYLGAGTGVAVLPILGTLVRRGSWLASESGLASYDRLTDAFAEIAMSDAVRGIMLEMDTPGGEANGCFDFADFIRKASEATGKPVWAHVNEVAASAGYAIASAAAQIWVPTTGEVGSIGVLAAHVDQSGADKKAGLDWTYIFAGEEKVDGNSHEPLSDSALSVLQADIDMLYGMFVDLVSRNRAMTPKAVLATKARMFRGKNAVAAGLADHIGTLDEALAALCAEVATR